MRTALMTILEGDTELMSCLPGGLHTKVEISRQETPDAFDEFRELRPCALLRFETEVGIPPFPNGSRLFFTVYFYEGGGVDCEEARKRVYALLHKQQVMPTNGGGCWEVSWTDDLLDRQDSVLKVSMCVSRFVATISR